MKKLFILILIVAIIFPVNVRAGEGMWIPLLMKKLNYKAMKKAGLKLSAKDLYDVNNGSLKDAIVSFGGFCTGEIISYQGLILTNHHCGYDAIQKNSTVEDNYLENGFWAKTREEEKTNPGLFVNFLVRIDDVSKDINRSLSDTMNERERSKAISTASKILTEKATENTEYKASVESFFHGNEFYLFVYEKFSDVRLVGAPPSSVGKYGGDTDNWMWPRQTGDFSLFRVYSSKEGKDAEYSEGNIPLKPKHSLPISLRGVEEGDFAMVWGYPGSTDRYLSSWGVKQAIEIYNPSIVEVRDAKLEIMRKYMNKDPEAKLKLASSYAQTANYWKYYIGQTEQLINNNVFGKKFDLEIKFTNWISENPKRQEKYGETLNLMRDFYNGTNSTVKNRVYMIEALYNGPAVVMFAYRSAAELARAIQSPKMLEKIRPRLMRRSKSHFSEFNAQCDRDLMAALFRMYAENISKEQQPEFLKEVSQTDGSFNAYANRIYETSIFMSEERYKSFLLNPDSLTLAEDPLIKITNDFRKLYFGSVNAELAAKKKKSYRLWTAGIREMMPKEDWSADANSTMRMTFGHIGSYEPKDGVTYNYYTTLDGVMEKEDPNNPEFFVPKRLKELHKAKDYGQYADKRGNLPVGLISDNDITGGNSGSPLINAKGELIGLAFDANWEAMSGDIFFEDKLQRTISVDIRYVLFMIDKYAGAGYLVDEMVLHY
ncbi:MAG: Dipeptidyl-peptidase 7 [Owenweeksia sp. TMED14]|nr:MAG: Dipeptidyl-peptidase 7 [Owenweeksia sp. TMED14]